jgi:predicted house-cleaning noncanonical NTP pyrophosphatase (MazG superfamily)
MEKIFNKLVRDNIPDIIANNGEESVTRVLEDKKYKLELYKKLLEEANEVINSKSPDETIEELADVLEILRAIAKLNGKELDDIIEVADQKKSKRGGFEKRIFLEKTYKK